MVFEQNTGYSIIQLLQLFAVYSFIGWLVDNVYCLIKDRHRFDRGILKGPYMPIYGVMMIISLLVAHQLEEDLAYMIMILFVIATAVELFAGILIHLVSSNRYWNYTGRFLNLHGYTCFHHSLKVTLLLAGSLVLVNPILMSFLAITPPWIDLVFLIVFYICFISDSIDAIYEGLFMRKFMKSDVKIYHRGKNKK